MTLPAGIFDGLTKLKQLCVWGGGIWWQVAWWQGTVWCRRPCCGVHVVAAHGGRTWLLHDSKSPRLTSSPRCCTTPHATPVTRNTQVLAQQPAGDAAHRHLRHAHQCDVPVRVGAGGGWRVAAWQSACGAGMRVALHMWVSLLLTVVVGAAVRPPSPRFTPPGCATPLATQRECTRHATRRLVSANQLATLPAGIFDVLTRLTGLCVLQGGAATA